MITRRDFIKGIGAILAAPLAMKLDLLEARQHCEYFGTIDGVRIESMGKVTVRDGDGAEYTALRYYLRKGSDESYCDVDEALVKHTGNPDLFIHMELQVFAEGINESFRQGPPALGYGYES